MFLLFGCVQKWESGISARQNPHRAVKHARLSFKH